MKFSSKIQRCELSPMRKFLPYELAAEAKGRKIYHLNIGQPDIETPKAFFDAVKNFQDPVLAYAAAPGVSEFLTAVQGYYANLGIHLEQSDIYATAGGSEALQMALTCILDEGDEILIPEPFYPNYNTFVSVTGGGIRPDLIDRIYERGVSSKGENRGTGLFLIKQLVEESHGDISIETEEGEGTCFTITFTGKEKPSCTM